MRPKRCDWTVEELQRLYWRSGSNQELAKVLGVSYPTAVRWGREAGLSRKSRGYTAPDFGVTGAECRGARESLGMTRDDFCECAGISKSTLREFELGNTFLRKASFEKVIKVFKKELNEFESWFPNAK